MKQKNINPSDDIDVEKDIKLKFLYEDLRRRRLETRSRYLLQMSVVVTILFTTMFSSLLLVNKDDRKDILLFPFITRREPSSESINQLVNDVSKTKQEIQTLNDTLNDIKNISLESRDIAVINSRVDEISRNISNINDTILEKPDTAITSKLIREKQISIDQKIENLSKDQQRMEDKVDGFLSNLIAVPLYGALAGLVFTIIASIASPIITKIKDHLLGVKDNELSQ